MDKTMSAASTTAPTTPTHQPQTPKKRTHKVVSFTIAEPGVRTKFLVDNQRFHSMGQGLRYRTSKSLDDKVVEGCEGAKWGTHVIGIDLGDGWLQVGRWFLPKILDGVVVLSQASEPDAHVTELCMPEAGVTEEPTPPTSPMSPTSPTWPTSDTSVPWTPETKAKSGGTCLDTKALAGTACPCPVRILSRRALLIGRKCGRI